MHDVVVIAVRNAVSAATITFTATSMIFFFIYVFFSVLISYMRKFRSPYIGDPCLLKGVCEILYGCLDSAGIPRPFRGEALSVLFPAPFRGGVRGGVNQ